MTYRGKVKIVEYLDDERVRITFTDDITAGDGAKKDNISGKGAINLKLSNMLMNYLGKCGIPHHQLKLEADNVLIARRLTMFPIEVVVRNVIAGSFARRYGFPEGVALDKPIVEFFVKDDERHDPLIDYNVAITKGMVTEEQISLMRAHAIQVNNALLPYFKKAGMKLVDFKLEFGYDKNGQIFVADELSADSMRVWDINTNEKLDKDRFRKDLGDVLAGYKAIIDRLENTQFEPFYPTITAIITILPKKGVTNPAGNVIRRTLINSGIENIEKVSLGKVVHIQIEDTSDPVWLDKLKQVCTDIITNPLIEEYSITFK